MAKRARAPDLRRPAASKRPARILVVDEQPIVRLGLRWVLDAESDLSVCGEASDAAGAESAVQRLNPDLVLLDLSLPGKGGLELIKDLVALRPGLPIVVFTAQDEEIFAERALRAGARGYVMKREGPTRLLQALRQVLKGRLYVSERLSARLLETVSSGARSLSLSPVASLSDREFEVFQLIGQGRGTRQIAEQLHLSVKTVEVHRAHIKQKLKLPDAPALVRYAVQWMATREAP